MTTHAASSVSDDGPVLVPISSLSPADSPRLMGADADHVQTLAEVMSDLPPILVHRPTMRIIDGTHRVRAAMQRGQDVVSARFVDGSQNEAFVLAVKENIAHGLPLSLADRKAAAARIIADHADWSDRSIAGLVGLAPTSVGRIRRCSTEQDGQSNDRVGRDGRVRPMDGPQRRQRVLELITAQPDAPLRQIAHDAQVSVSTAHAVRKSLLEARGNATPIDADSSRRDQTLPRRATQISIHSTGTPPMDWTALRPRLRADPALRYTESGRKLLHWLDTHAVGTQDWPAVAQAVPGHWSESVAQLAYEFAMQWRVFAETLHGTHEATPGPSPASLQPSDDAAGSRSMT